MDIHIVQKDITTMDVDAIVNAANSSLMGGGGVDGAIHRAGGKEILDECMKIRESQGGCPTGEAVMTTAGKLPAKKVIHTVGPVWKSGKNDEDELLSSCYKNSLQLAEESKFQSIAFPNISTGVYGFPKKRAAKIAVETVQNHKSKHITDVYFVCFDEENYQLYRDILSK